MIALARRLDDARHIVKAGQQLHGWFDLPTGGAVPASSGSGPVARDR